MQTLIYTKTVKADLLKEQLAAAYPGHAFSVDTDYRDGICQVTVLAPGDVSGAGVAAIVAAHDPRALDADERATVEQDVRDRLTKNLLARGRASFSGEMARQNLDPDSIETWVSRRMPAAAPQVRDGFCVVLRLIMALARTSGALRF